jgi:hypothetical protein
MSEAPVFSRESRIRIDRDGRFWHEGERVEHEGLARAFAQWIRWDDASQRYQLRNEIDWCWITVEDAPLVVWSASVGEDGSVTLALSDGTCEPLALESLRIDRDDVPYCTVRGQSVDARFSPSAAFALLEHAEPDGDGWAIVLGGAKHALRRVERGCTRGVTH